MLIYYTNSTDVSKNAHVGYPYMGIRGHNYKKAGF
jgi:hypothetical protein